MERLVSDAGKTELFSEQADDVAWVGALDCSLSRRPMFLSKRKSQTPNNQVGLEAVNFKDLFLASCGHLVDLKRETPEGWVV